MTGASGKGGVRRAPALTHRLRPFEMDSTPTTTIDVVRAPKISSGLLLMNLADSRPPDGKRGLARAVAHCAFSSTFWNDYAHLVRRARCNCGARYASAVSS